MQQQLEVADEVERPPLPPAKPGLLRYNSPLVQVFLTGLVCFCSAGMFNALSGLGGAGQLDHTIADDANTALYACFTVFGVLGVPAHNLLGPWTTVLLGALAYPLYDSSFLYYNHRPASIAFPVATGTVLGAGAGLLWATQGAIITTYPSPNRHGTYISLFLCLYNLGSVFGGLFPLSFNYHRGGSGSVNDGTTSGWLCSTAGTPFFPPVARSVVESRDMAGSKWSTTPLQIADNACGYGSVKQVT
ncbi:unnamed protein product [Miscanthus lutarioriparius]|uniref:Uncharacterized protein n=1 Tax=Miscanthus lutarioriparius TaxID=422564 RepID=A0A811PJ46_9POAL|nr:unnamed protein product [Miscanthus lutarioriparius]